jgi:hypothetical protein
MSGLLDTLEPPSVCVQDDILPSSFRLCAYSEVESDSDCEDSDNGQSYAVAQDRSLFQPVVHISYYPSGDPPRRWRDLGSTIDAVTFDHGGSSQLASSSMTNQ